MTQSLKTLLEHAERQRDEGLLAVQQAESQEQALRTQAEQLQAYRAEYEARHPARSGRAAPIELLRCHLGFMQRLQQAQAQQQTQWQAAQVRLVQRRESLLALEIRVAAVRKLIERRVHDKQQTHQRQEQRRNDEAVQRHGWQRRTEPTPLG